MDIEKKIIDKCAESPILYAEAIDQAVIPEMFSGQSKDIWEYAIKHMKAHGSGPTDEAITVQFPDYVWDFPASEPLSYYVEQLKRKHAFNLTLVGIQSAYDNLNKREVESAVDDLRDALRKIEDATASEADLDWGTTAEDRYNDYLDIQNKGGIDGYRTPFDTLDQATQGWHDGEFILVVARQGVGKTWLTNIMAHKNYKDGLKVLYFTKEMPSKQVARRFDALEYELPYQDLRSGQLNSFKEAEWRQKVQEGLPKGQLVIVGEETGGVSQVAAKIERHKPDIIFIDGMYLMDDDQRARDNWLKISNISRDMKRLSKRVMIPIIATVQFNRSADNSKGDASNIAYGDIAKDADIILGLFQDEDQRLDKRMTLRVLKQREGARPEIELDWDMANMKFNEVHDSGMGTVNF
jgi:replicative DNA helicase